MNIPGSPEYEELNKITFAITLKGEVVGTGFFFTKDGWALTAWHVIEHLDEKSICISYQEDSKTAIVARKSLEYDVALLFVPGVVVKGHVPLATQQKWDRRDSIVAVGYQQQKYLRGLNPLDLHIDHNRPLRPVHFNDDKEQECLILIPDDPNYVIQAGSSGGPILNKRTHWIIGVILGTMVDTRKGTLGFAIPFDNLFLDWPRFRRFLNSSLEVLPDEDRPTVDEPLEDQLEPKCIMRPIPLPPAQPDFEMAASLVTNRQFKEFLEDNAYWLPHSGCQHDRMVDSHYLSHWSNGVEQIADYPVVNVSWHAAQAYVSWLSKKLGKSLRLPRQQEWEDAARAGRSWEKCREEELNPEAVGVNYKYTLKGTSPVNKFRRNPYGLYDILGNVYELCFSEGDVYYARGGAYNSRTWEELITPKKLQRNECREDVGFRYVRDLSSTQEGNHDCA